MEETIIRRAQDSDQEALAYLIQENYAFIFKFLIKLTMNKNISEDLTQETMMKAIEKIKTYNPDKSKFSTWLITIAQNSFIDYLRKNKHISKNVNIEAIDAGWDTGGSEATLEWQSVLDQLLLLPDTIRLPIILKHYYGYSYDELSYMMSIPAGTIKSRIHNGLNTLRKGLADNE